MGVRRTHPSPASPAAPASATARTRRRAPVTLAVAAGLLASTAALADPPATPGSAAPSAPPSAGGSTSSAPTSGATVTAPPKSAGTPAPICNDLSGLRADDLVATPAPDWLTVYRLTTTEPSAEMTDAEALAALCAIQAPGCFDKPGLYWIEGEYATHMSVLQVAPEGRWVYPNISELSGSGHETNFTELGNGRVHAALSFEWIERVPFCGADDEAEENERTGNCTTASALAGTEYRDLLIDTSAHRVLWRASCSVDEDNGAAHPVTAKGDTFTWQGCEPKPVPVRFDLARLRSCPPPDPEAATTESAPGPGGSPSSDSAATEPSDAAAPALSRTASLADARKQAKAKNFKGALARFDALLAAADADLPVRAERGFVRLLAGDLVGAESDLSRCAREVPEADRVLRAQVFFNLGLLAEKRSEPNNARRYFELSHGYKPTSATKKRLAAPAP